MSVSYPRVAVIGDSLAAGWDASTPSNTYARLIMTNASAGIPAGALPALAQRNNGSATQRFIHGVGGITSGQMLANLQAFNLVPASDLLVVELGTDDFIRNVPLAQFTSDYAALLSRLDSRMLPVATVLLTP